jgi:hypothetical protein
LDEAQTPTAGKPSPKVVMALGLMALLFVAFLLPRLLGGRSHSSESEVGSDGVTETLYTLTPVSETASALTATPLALEAQDDVITGGDSARAVAYPVNLQVILAWR